MSQKKSQFADKILGGRNGKIEYRGDKALQPWRGSGGK